MEKTVKKPVRVRIAPSPTGQLHIGTARTALYNWLFAQQHKGAFIVRIEDTDKERSKKEYEENILEGLKWLGLDWSEGPYRQSERTEHYTKYLKQLLDDHHAYHCFCAKEELEAERTAMLADGRAPKYSGRCRNLAPEEVRARIEKGAPSVLRLKVPAAKLQFHDMIRGTLEFNMELVGDIVIAKNFETPLYNFAVVIDDEEMKISHVIRGEDHLANTPKQIVMQRALGFTTPHYAHLPLILAPNRSKLSKRDLETSLDDYRADGYLPEAIINFIALLGWHPKEDKEILTREELIHEFDITRIQKAGAVFGIEKLDWINSQYIRKTPDEELQERIKAYIPASWHAHQAILAKALAIEKERMKKLSEFKELAGFMFELPDYDAELLAWPRAKPLDKKKVSGHLEVIEEKLSALKEEFTKSNLERALMPLAEKLGRGEVLWPLRAALSGSEASPGPFEIMEVLGKKETLARLTIAQEKCA